MVVSGRTRQWRPAFFARSGDFKAVFCHLPGLSRAGSGHLGICFAVMMMAINLRMDVWVAAAYGVAVAEAHRLQPLWIVPVLTLALVAWVGVAAGLARPKPRVEPD
jgi:hypothetical protein